jgi:transposase InsO family protein
MLIKQIKKANSSYSVNELCGLFDVILSSYYAQIQPKKINLAKEKIMLEIKEISQRTSNTYGKRRILESLLDKGYKLGLYKTASLMKRAQVVAINPVKKHYYPDNGKEQKYFPNLLNRQFNQETLNTHWVGDITYIRTHQGWSYLACVLDLGSREIVGYAFSQHPNAALAKKALQHAIRMQQPDTSHLMFHSDQGTQYSAHEFTRYLSDLEIIQSMSRRGNCWDNSVMERFFRSLKTERLNHISLTSHFSAKSIVEAYIRFYNYERLHSAIGYTTPNKYSKRMKKTA